MDYYLATRACLQWEHLPPGQQGDFESASVQRRFYQKVIKRLENEIFKWWGLRLENLGSFNSEENKLCWGSIGREVVLHQIGKTDSSDTNNGTRSFPHRSISDVTPAFLTLQELGECKIRSKWNPLLHFPFPLLQSFRHIIIRRDSNDTRSQSSSFVPAGERRARR